jgi:hypothetical protein
MGNSDFMKFLGTAGARFAMIRQLRASGLGSLPRGQRDYRPRAGLNRALRLEPAQA